ncbi:DUF721 domain-containing protein [Roseibium aggregatum]|nr:DciA family protein [Roseibium aggregatum]
MSAREKAKGRNAAKPLADLVGKAMTPACRKRGFASVDILASWPDIVGERYGERVQPERLIWPRQPEEAVLADDAAPKPATLVVHTDGPTALMLSHEMPQIIERINAFYGWAAVGRIKIVQRPVAARAHPRRKVLPPLTGAEEKKLDDKLSGFEHDGLRNALKKLGSQVIAREKASK